jgi:hypothetical protein
MDGKYSIRAQMDIGVAIAAYSFAHLPDPAARMRICLITAVNARIDDMVVRGEDMVHVYRFNERFVNCQPQGNPILNALDVLLREITCLHSPLVSNIITASILNFVSSICLDYETKNMQVWFISEQRLHI